MATQSDIIRIACWRYSHADDGSLNKTSAEYADGITAIPSPPSSLIGLYRSAVAKGGGAAELASLYRFSAWADDMNAALQASNITDIKALVNVISELSNVFTDTTLNALLSSIGGQRLVDVVAAEPDKTDESGNPITMPESITEADVDAALGR